MLHPMTGTYPKPPKVTPVMLQGWHEIAFFHWSCTPDLLGPRLPAELQIDTYMWRVPLPRRRILRHPTRKTRCPDHSDQ